MKSENAYNSKGITISAARYASEDASILVHFAIAVLEYSKLCIPLKAAKEKVEALRQEKIDYDRKKREHEQEVYLNFFFLLFCCSLIVLFMSLNFI